MKKTKDYTLLALFIPFLIAVLACSCNDPRTKTPLERHTDYILEKHNDNCRYELGECTEPLCSKSDSLFRDYQLELLADSTQIWQGHRLVATIHYSASIDSVLLLDNQ